MMIKDFSREDLLLMARDIANYNGMFEEIGYADDNLNDFLKTYFAEPIDAIRAWSYGGANYDDDYYRMNIYGNIESLSAEDLLDECECNRDEIVEEYVRLVEKNYIDDYNNFIDDELLEELGYTEEED